MAIDPSIALQLRPFQMEPRTNALARIVGLQGQMRQNALGELQMQQAQEAAARDKQVRDVMSGNDLSKPEGLSALMRVDPIKAMAIQKEQLLARKTEADIGHVQGQTTKDAATTAKTQQAMKKEAFNQYLQELGAVDSPASAQAWVQNGVRRGIGDMQTASRALQGIPTDPAAFAKWKRDQMIAGVDLAKQFDIANQDRTFGATQANNLMIPDGKGGYMVNQPLAAAKSSIAASGKSNISINTGQKGLDNELKLRGDFRQEPVYKAHQEMQSAHGQIKQAIAQASPAGDLAAATKIMKLLDPGSVVRESELGMAMAATGILDRVSNYGNMILTGQKLSPAQRKDFGSLADRLMGESVKAYNSKRGEYENLGGKYGMDMGSALGPKSPDVQPAAPKSGPQVLKFDANGNMVK